MIVTSWFASIQMNNRHQLVRLNLALRLIKILDECLMPTQCFLPFKKVVDLGSVPFDLATLNASSAAQSCFSSQLCALRQALIRAGHVPSSHRKSTIDFIPQLIDFGITINLTLEFIPTS
jgi:hypothetical protein